MPNKESVPQYIRAFFAFLVVPLMFLLWVQWPLREFLHSGYREANDLGQIVFAYYLAVAVSVASISGTHLHVLKKTSWINLHPSISVLPSAFLTLPWALLLSWYSLPLILQSFYEHEKFPESLMSGFYFLKAALIFLPVCIVISIFFRVLSKEKS